jgi:hypothetical protein
MSITYATYATPRADLGAAFLEYVPEGATMIADQVLPVTTVGLEAGTYTKITRESILTMEDAKHSEGAYNRIGFTGEDATYACEERALEFALSDKKLARFSRDFDAEMVAVMHLRHKLAMTREKAVKDLVFNTSTWTGAPLYTDVSSAPWDAAGSDAIGHVAAAASAVRTNCGIAPDTLIVGYATMQNLLKNTAIRASFPGVQILSADLIRANAAAIFGLNQIVVGNMVYNSADEGYTASLTDLWGDDYAMICKVCSPGSIESPGIGRTFQWVEDADSMVVFETYREEQTRSNVYRVRQNVDEVIQDAYFGHLLKVDA